MPCIDTLQGFSFCPAARERLTIIYSYLSAVNAIIQPQRQNRLQGFAVSFPLIRPIPARTIQQPHKPPMHRLRHAGGHTVKCSASTDTRYHRHAGTLHRSAQAVYYNKVYKGADHASGGKAAPAVRKSLASAASGAPAEGSASPPVQGQPGGVSMLPEPGGWRSGTFHPAGQSSGRSAAGGAEPLAALAAFLFGLSPDSQ